MRDLPAWAAAPRAERLARLHRTADELAGAVLGHAAEAMRRRPDARSWAAVEVLCHLRDVEESFLDRMTQIMAMDEPVFITTSPDRWADERQYLANEAGGALSAFSRRRGETLAFLGTLREGDWRRGGRHTDSRGRRTIDDFVGVMAWHDENHVAQLVRALEGRP